MIQKKYIKSLCNIFFKNKKNNTNICRVRNVSNKKTTFIKYEKLHDHAFMTYTYTVYKCSMREQ